VLICERYAAIAVCQALNACALTVYVTSVQSGEISCQSRQDGAVSEISIPQLMPAVARRWRTHTVIVCPPPPTG
jgi:hypothetical protein